MTLHYYLQCIVVVQCLSCAIAFAASKKTRSSTIDGSQNTVATPYISSEELHLWLSKLKVSLCQPVVPETTDMHHGMPSAICVQCNTEHSNRVAYNLPVGVQAELPLLHPTGVSERELPVFLYDLSGPEMLLLDHMSQAPKNLSSTV